MLKFQPPKMMGLGGGHLRDDLGHEAGAFMNGFTHSLVPSAM